jgi:cell wall-associated NlpC family hydrolase
MVVRGAGVIGCLICLVFSTPAPASAGGVYFVKSGDTLTGISRLFGVAVDRIQEVNHLQTAGISPGDMIRIPDRPPKPAPVVEVSRPRGVSSDRVLQAVCRDETVYHSVVRGDTLSAIANRYAMELDNLLQLNGLRKSARLAIGQKIVVRKSGPRTHTIARGETLTRIASRYGIAASEIAQLNRLDGNKVAAGQRLVIDPCDPYAAAGSVPPPLDGPGSDRLEIGSLNTTTSGSAAAVSQQVIEFARSMLNVPYRFGGSTLRGIDCSAYVQRVFGFINLQIPRTAREQYSVGARIVRDDIQIGDLVFFRTYASFPSHVGIYLGENLFIHASSMVRKVAIDSLDQPYYRKRFIGARRLLVDDAPAVASTP